MAQDNDFPARPDARNQASAFGSADTTIEAAADFERAIRAAQRDGPSPDVDPRVHDALIEAMRSELAELREQIDGR